VYSIASRERMRYGTNSARERPHDSGSTSGNTTSEFETLAVRHGINPKTMAKWRKRTDTVDLAMGPKEARSTVLTPEHEAMIVAFRKLTLLPLNGCFYALQPSVSCLMLHEVIFTERPSYVKWIA
jgi:transposase-like protein